MTKTVNSIGVTGPEDTVTVVFPDIGLSGRVLEEEGVAVMHGQGKQEDGIVFGIVTNPSADVVQFNMEHTVRLRDLLNKLIEANS